MSAFDQPDWNLAQAAAWVVYRERELVASLAYAPPLSFTSIAMYPTMWPPGRQEVGTLTDLRDALRSGRLVARGYHVDDPNNLKDIPREEWADLRLSPPNAYALGRPNAVREPWTAIRVDGATVKSLWRSVRDVSGRTRFDWPAIEGIYNELRALHSEMSDNELITEIQGAFGDKYDQEPPSRSSIQNHLKIWKAKPASE